MGELDLPKQFGRRAKAMLTAVEAGRGAHLADNIKASGAPLEAEFRRLLAESLPSTNKVASGYFYGASSRCSGEIDVLVYEAQEAFRLDPAPQDQHYVPYTSVSILGQIRNSARDLPGAIDQVKSSLKSWHDMNRELAQTGTTAGSPFQMEPLTFVVCGECKDADQKKLGSILAKKGRPFVDYILLLDRGEIVAGNLDFFETDNPVIDFLEYRNVNTFHICKPDGGASDRLGAALLWFYFALVSKLSLDKGNNLRFHAFCRQIAAQYPLRPTRILLDSSGKAF